MAIPDDKTLEELTTYREPIYRYVLNMVRDAAEAEDLTQQTLVRAVSYMLDLRAPDTWPEALEGFSLRPPDVWRGLAAYLMGHALLVRGRTGIATAILRSVPQMDRLNRWPVRLAQQALAGVVPPGGRD